MMIRVWPSVVAAAAAGLMVTSLPGSASAAHGTLRVSGRTYNNPRKGCYTGIFWPLVVSNQTNQTVLVYDNATCHGHVMGTVAPRRSGIFEFGEGVRVPR